MSHRRRFKSWVTGLKESSECAGCHKPKRVAKAESKGSVEETRRAGEPTLGPAVTLGTMAKTRTLLLKRRATV